MVELNFDLWNTRKFYLFLHILFFKKIVHIHHVHTVSSRISSMGAYFFEVLHRDIFERGLIRKGALEVFLVVGHCPVEIFPLMNYFFDSTNTSNKI